MNIFVQSPSVDTGKVQGLCTDQNANFHKGTVKSSRYANRQVYVLTLSHPDLSSFNC